MSAPPAAPGSGAVLSLSVGEDQDCFVEQLLAAMRSYRQGDIPARLPANLTGPNGAIADAFNDIVTMSEQRARTLAQERERLLQGETAARRDAERQSRLKDEFLATLSHELRTPMNAILGWLEILDSGKPIRDMTSALAVIRRNAQRQAKLIDDLLDMNRLLSGNVSLDRSDVDVAALVQTTVQSLNPLVQQTSVQLLAVVAGGPGTIRADARRLQQALWNVLHNAVKFTPGGRVELRLRRQGEQMVITVQDTGKGMSPAFLPYAFDRFRQENSTTTREFCGLGLGLAIARHLIELHGGTIDAASGGEGRGATFTLRIPTDGLDPRV